MKKLLIPLVCSLIAAWSCNLEGSYSAQNVWDIVTIQQHKLVNDSGVVYNVSSAPKDMPELEEGKRYYLVFDILNKSYEIAVQTCLPVAILVPTPADEAEEITAHDPILVQFNYIGSKYIDLGFNYYYDDRSNFAHEVFGRYTISVDPQDGNHILNLSLYHDGNSENPAVMDEASLKLGTRIVSIPVDAWDFKAVTLTVDILSTNDDGKYVVESKTYPSR